MTDAPRQLEWVRTPGDFANAAQIQAGSHSLIGVAADHCPCCDAEYAVIAAVHAAGFEVSVSLDGIAALQVANAILDAYARLNPEKAKHVHG